MSTRCHPEPQAKDLRLLVNAPRFCNGVECARAREQLLYFTYVTASRSRTLYIGMTSDLRKRVFQHNGKSTTVSPHFTTVIVWCGTKAMMK
jgi:hypothetical protein